MSPRSVLLFALSLLALFFASGEAAPFFDAIYAAINGNSHRSYPSGYGYSDGYAYGGGGYRPREVQPRQGKSYRDICRVHNPQGWSGGCPY